MSGYYKDYTIPKSTGPWWRII